MANRTYTVGGRTYTVSDKERQNAIQEIATKGYRDYSKVVNEVNSLTDNQRAALEAALINNQSVRQRDARNRPEDTAIAKYIEAIKEITREDGTVPYGPKSYRFNVYADGVPDANARKAYDSLSYKDQLLLDIDKKGKPVTPDFGDPNVDTSVYDRYQQALAKVEQDAVAKADADAVKAIEDAYRNNRGNYEYDPKEAARAIKESNKQVPYTQSELVDLYEGLQDKYDWDDEAYAEWNTPAPASSASRKTVATRNVKREVRPADNAPVVEAQGGKNKLKPGQTLEQLLVQWTTPKDSDKVNKVKAIAEAERNAVGNIFARWGSQYSRLTGRDDGEQAAKSQFATDAVNVYMSSLKGATSAAGDVANAAAHTVKEANALYRKWVRGDDSEIKEGEFAQKYPITGYLLDAAFAVGDAADTMESVRGNYLKASTGNTEASRVGKQVANVAETVSNSAARMLGAAVFAPGKVANMVFYALSAAGGTYDDMLEAGNTKGRAAAMAAWNAVTEGIVESYTDKVLLAGGKGIKSVLNGIIGNGKKSGLIRAGAAKLNNKYGVLALRFLTAGGSEGAEEYIQYFLDKAGKRIILGDTDPVSHAEALKSAAMGMLCGTIFAGMGLAGDTISETTARTHAEKMATDIVENRQTPPVEETIQLAEEVAAATAETPITSEELDAAESEGLALPEAVKTAYKQAADALTASEGELKNARVALQEAQASLPFGDPTRVEAVKRYTDAVKARNKAGADVEKAYGKLRQAVDTTAAEIDAEMLARAQAYAEQDNQLAQYQFDRNLKNDPEGMMQVLAQQEVALTAEMERLQVELDALPAGDSRGRELFAEIQQLGTAIDGIKQMVAEAAPAIAPTTAAEIPANVDVGLTQAFDEASLAADVREVVNKNRDQLKAVDAIAKKYGRKVVMVDTLKGKTISGQTITADVNGYYDPQTGAIYIAADAQEGAFSYFAIHELVHSIKNSDPEGYEALCDTIMEELVNNGEDVDALIDYQQNVVYKGAIDLETAIEEVVANTAPAILTDENYVRSMYEGNRSLFDKIRDFFNELKQAFANLTQYRSWEQGASLGADSVAKIAEVFDRVAATPDGGGGGGARFSLKRPVERVGNLVAVHSLSARNAIDAVRKGGMPAPSIALIERGMDVPDFGDVTIVFPRNTIDPETDPRNNVYPGDAYTPMHPATAREIPKDVDNRIKALVKNLSGKMGRLDQDAVRISFETYADMSDAAIYKEADNNPYVMLAYLAENGRDISQYVKKGIYWTDAEREIKKEVLKFGVKNKYHKWIDSILEGKTPGYEYFLDDEGNRIHATLENIASYMAGMNGGEMRNAYNARGAEGVFASMTPRLNSIADIHSQEQKLQHHKAITAAEMAAYNARLDSITRSIVEEADLEDWSYGSNPDDWLPTLQALGKGNDFSDQVIIETLQREGGFTPSQELVSDIQFLLTGLRDMKVPFFEAKPTRVVPITEAALVLVPDIPTSEDVEKAFKSVGVKVVRYGGYLGSRVETLNKQAAKLRFSRKDFNRSTRTPATKSQGSLAQQLIAENASRAKESRVTDLLNTARQAMANGNAKAADEAGLAMAREILTNTGAVDTSADSIKTELRGMNIAPTAEERANIAATYGSYDAYRRAVAGVVPLGGVGKQGAISIDQAIGVLQQDFPGQVTGDDRMEWLYQFAQNNPKGKINYDGDLEADAAELWNQIKRDNSDFFNSSETAPFDVPDFNVKDIKVNKTAAKDWLSKTVSAGATADQVREYASKRRYTELSAKGRQFWNNVLEAAKTPGQQDFRMSDDEALAHDTIHLFQGNSPYTQGNGIQMDHERSTARANRKLSAIRNEVQRIIGFTYNDEYYNGAARRRGATAYFEPAHNFVSSSDTNNMTAFLHEGGHALNMEQLDPDEVQVFLQEMPATFIGQYDLLDRPAEAGAEMFRAWMLNPTSMEQKYPNTFAALRRQLGQRRYNDLREQGNVYRRFIDSTTPEKIEGVLHETTRRQPRDWGQTFRNAVKRTMDRGYGLKKLDRSATSHGINLAGGGADARASQARTASQAVEALFFDGMYNRRGNRVACSLAECVRGLRGEQKMRDFNAYLELKQALDRHAANNQDWVFSNDVCTVAEARSFVERVEREQQDIVEAANNVWKWLRTYRDTQLSTAIPQEVKDRWEELNPHYIPQTRNFTLDISGAVHGGGVGGQGTGVNGRRVGSTRDIVSPIDAIANMVARTKSAALQHEVLKTLQEYYDRDQGGVVGQFIHEIDPQRVPHVVPADVIRRAATNTLEGVGLAGEDLQIIDDLLNANLEDDVTFETRTPNGRVGNAFAITENGVTRYYEIHDQDLLDSLTRMPAPQLGAVLGSSKTVTGFISSLITAKNPAFALGNAVRDVQEAYFTGSTQNPFVFAWDYLGALVDVVGNRDVVRQYRAMGGSSGLSSVYADGKSVDDLKRAMFGAAGDNRNAAKLAFDRLGDAIETFNGAIETVPRLAEYKRQLRRGAAYADAIKAAKNCTTDFSSSGSATAPDKALWRFFNASMQSTYKAANMFVDGAASPQNRRRLASQMTAAITMGVVGRALAEILLQANDDDDTYAAMPEYTKDSYWIIPTNEKGKFVKIPLPNGAYMSTINSLGRRIGLAAMGIKDGGEVGEILGEQATGLLMDVLNGINPFGEFNEGNPLGSNFVFNPLIQISTNTSWTGTPIVPASMEGMSPALQYDDKTSDVAKVIGKAINISPMKIDYLISQNSGVIGEINEALTAAKNDGVGAGIKEFFLSRFMVDTAYSQQVTSGFYDEKEKLQQLIEDVEETQKRGEQPYSPIFKGLNPKQARQAAAEAKELKKKMDSLGKNLSDIVRQAAQAANAGDEEKARELRFKQQQLAAEATLAAANFFDKWNNLNK